MTTVPLRWLPLQHFVKTVACLIGNYTIFKQLSCVYILISGLSIWGWLGTWNKKKLTCEKKTRPFCMPLYMIHRSVSCTYKLNKPAFFSIRICYPSSQFHQLTSHRATAENGSVCCCISGCCYSQRDTLPPSTVHCMYCSQFDKRRSVLLWTKPWLERKRENR